MGFKDLLRAELEQTTEISAEILAKLPRGFQEIDRRIILNLHPSLHPHATQIAEGMSRLLPRIKGIWLRTGKIEGKFRQPMGLQHLWGDAGTEIIVKENNIRYNFDFTKIMFAKGNVYERALLPKRIPKGLVVVDMFAGIGYFSMGIGKISKPECLYSIEWNPVSFGYLQANVKLNKLEGVLHPRFGDCKEIVNELKAEGVKPDWIIMGLIPAPVDAIPAALSLVKETGTTIVYEGVETKDSTRLFDEFTAIAKQHGMTTELVDRRAVKNFRPHEYHYVLEILAKK